MHPNAALIERFYSAFASRDAQTMADSYAPSATFSDPVFQDLKGPEVSAMWAMLVSRGQDLEVTWSDVEANDESGSASWEARYTFTATGRKVHNRIAAQFTFEDGRIATHEDTFDLWAWTRMALGMPGVLLGWSPLVQNKVRGQANAQLRRYLTR